MADLTVYFKQGLTVVKSVFDFNRNSFSPMQLAPVDLDEKFVSFYKGVKINAKALGSLEHQFSREFKEDIFTKVRTMSFVDSFARNSRSGAHACPDSINDFYKN